MLRWIWEKGCGLEVRDHYSLYLVLTLCIETEGITSCVSSQSWFFATPIPG